MRLTARLGGRLLVSLCLALAVACVAFAQEQPKDKQPTASDAEIKEAKKVEAATDAQARLQAAGAFLKKYPKSEFRPQVAQLVAAKIDETTDPAQKLTLAENYLKVFNQPSEADVINPVLLSAYLKNRRTDDAFALAAKISDTLPNPVPTLMDLSYAGYTQAQQQNVKYVGQSIQYAGRAIELLEADKKPAHIEAAAWNDYKTKLLPSLYQVQGYLLLVGGDQNTAKERLIKATTLNPADPMNFALLSSIRSDEYQGLAAKYKAATGAAQAETLKQALAILDQIIDDDAHAVALSEGNPSYKAMHDQIMQDLESNYKYRHNGSTEGLRALIDKYKQPAAPKP